MADWPPEPPFRHRCEHCGHHAVIGMVELRSFDSLDASEAVEVYIWGFSCPNPDCGRMTLRASTEHIMAPPTHKGGPPLKLTTDRWRLLPRQKHGAKLHDSVPDSVAEDYAEARAILNLSPKAAATLGRRCLQGMIRDFWKVSRGTLYAELDAVRERVAPDVWEAIDVLRRAGNVGAQPEKDVSLIVPIEPGEADALLSLVDLLSTEWYRSRADRAARLEAVRSVGKRIDADRAQVKEKLKSRAAPQPEPSPDPQPDS